MNGADVVVSLAERVLGSYQRRKTFVRPAFMVEVIVAAKGDLVDEFTG